MRNKARTGVPRFDFTHYDLEILKSAIALFAEALVTNKKPFPYLHLAALNLSTLQEKIDDLLCERKNQVEFNFNESVIIINSLNMHHLDVVLFSPGKATPQFLRSLQGMVAYFTATQCSRSVD